MNKSQIYVLFFLSIFFTGCNSALNVWGDTVRMGKKYPPVAAENVIILFEKPSKKYEVIGLVSALGGAWTSDGVMFKSMQKSAAVLGADAIIVRSESGNGMSSNNGSIVVMQQQNSAIEYPKTSAFAIKYL
jgi:hypothetical protein